MAQAQAEMARIQRAVVQIQQAAEADDPAAVAMMALLAEQYQSAEQRVKDRRELLSELELLNISDAEERQATRAFWNAHRNEYGTLAAARKGMLGERFEKEREALAQKSKKADEAIAAARPDRVETYARPVPRSEAKARTMPESEFDNEIARLSRDGDTEAVRALMRELRSGTLKTTRG
jgi:hypothetical protein